ncbi:hypothetical protein [Burkholderia phage BCSR5]|nr:hypothetical protein [Burkholderia phage BCSR5]
MRTINLLQALRAVRKDKDNEEYMLAEEIGPQVNINGLYGNWEIEGFDERLKGYWLIKWQCTDTWVGTCAIFLDNELVGYFSQGARRSSKEWEFVNQEAVDKLHAFLKPKPNSENIEFIDPDEEIPTFFSYPYEGGQLIREGRYQNRECKYVVPQPEHIRKKAVSTEIEVEFSDSTRAIIPAKEFMMPIQLEDI